MASITMDVEVEKTSGSAGSPAYFQEALQDAERLLKYAAETGVDVDANTSAAVLRARADFSNGWSEDVAAKLLLALTDLAGRLKPVTAASLEACHSETRPTMHHYLVWAIILSAVIIPASILMFVTSSIADSMRDDINTANALVVKLSSELGPPARPDIGSSIEIAELQEYASTVRSIYARARRLNQFVYPHVDLPPPLVAPSGNPAERAEYLKKKFELAIPMTDLAAARDNMTVTYQDVRYFAQNIMSDTSTFYGALNSCILPILYALLGTCAYLLRTFEDQMGTRTFIPSAANSARFVIAAIGGTVIGLFGGFTARANASPLAIAFLVGYAVEVFFSFLEGLIQSLPRAPRFLPLPAQVEGHTPASALQRLTFSHIPTHSRYNWAVAFLGVFPVPGEEVLIGTIYKCEICGLESSAPVRWFVIHCCDTNLGIFKWDHTEADKPSSLHFCGEAHAQVYISRWFESFCGSSIRLGAK